MSQYPGPDDPFSRPPNEDGGASTSEPPAPPPPPAPDASPPPPVPPAPTGPGTDETAPIQREELGYWEKQALEKQPPAGGTPQQPPGYQQNPTSAQGYGETAGDRDQPDQNNPWSGYGEPATYGQPTPPPTGPVPPAYGYAQPAYAGAYAAPQQAHPRATTALVLGLIGLIGGCLCGVPALAAPFAWAMGAKAKREIRESNGALGGEGNAQAGFIMGIIGTVVLAVVIIGVILLVIGLAVGGSSGGSTNF